MSYSLLAECGVANLVIRFLKITFDFLRSPNDRENRYCAIWFVNVCAQNVWKMFCGYKWNNYICSRKYAMLAKQRCKFCGKRREAHASSCHSKPEKFQIDTRWNIVTALTLWRGMVVSLYLCLSVFSGLRMEDVELRWFYAFFVLLTNVMRASP